MQEVGRKPIMEQLADEEKARAARKESTLQDAANAGDHQEDAAVVAEMIDEQTGIAVSVTTVTRRRPLDVGIRRNPNGTRRVHLSVTQVGTLYAFREIVAEIMEHASDGSEMFADSVLEELPDLLGCYPVKWVDPKPKKKPDSQGSS